MALSDHKDMAEKVIVGGAIIAIVASAKKVWQGVRAVWRFLVNRFNAIPNLTRTLQDLSNSIKAQEARYVLMDEHVREVHDKAILAHAQGVLILEQSNTPMWHCALPSGVCTWVNDALCKAFGLSREDMMTWGWTKSLHPDDVKETLSGFMECVTGGRPYRARYRVLDSNGEPITYEATGEVINGVDGKPIAIFGKSVPLKVHL